MCDGNCDQCERAECLYPITLREYIEIVEDLDYDD